METLGERNGDRASVLSLRMHGYGVLHCAASYGHLEVYKYLMEELGGDANMTGADGPSLITLSPFANWQLLYMINIGPCCTIRYMSSCLYAFHAGVTVLMAFAQSDDLSTEKYFLDHGGDLMKAEEKGGTVLHHALYYQICCYDCTLDHKSASDIFMWII